MAPHCFLGMKHVSGRIGIKSSGTSSDMKPFLMRKLVPPVGVPATVNAAALVRWGLGWQAFLTERRNRLTL